MKLHIAIPAIEYRVEGIYTKTGRFTDEALDRGRVETYFSDSTAKGRNGKVIPAIQLRLSKPTRGVVRVEWIHSARGFTMTGKKHFTTPRKARDFIAKMQKLVERISV